VVSRLYAVETELPAAKGEIRALAAGLTPDLRPGDFAQAMMDLGATICTPQKPACALCPWMEPCAARRRGDADTFPRKAARKEGRLRRGAAFVAVTTDRRILVRTRPGKGLLGGMTEVPGSDWSHDFDVSRARDAAPPLAGAHWRRVAGTVAHVFTHFPLELVVYTAEVAASPMAPDGMRWIALDTLPGEALPNVMRKVVAHALDEPKRRHKDAGAGRPRGSHS
jgi:A/G-specific adenine glycosylase